MSETNGGTSSALIFGHEDSLSSSRKWLLGTINCHSMVVTSLAECRRAMLAEAFQLVVLCQTLSLEECKSISEFSAEHCPDAPLLIMFSRHTSCVPRQDYVVLDAMAGPEAFVQTTGRILANAAMREPVNPVKRLSSEAPI